MKQLESISAWIIHRSFKLSVWLIERFHHMETYEAKMEQLRSMKQGTLGREVVDCLDKYHLRLVPHYESHDLKHTLLDFKMSPIDEIRLQAFMIGNGNLTWASFAIFLFGFILLPTQWGQFYRDFKAGWQSKAIKEWTLEAYADKDLLSLRKEVLFSEQKQFNWEALINKTVYFASLSAMLAGGFGMLYCLPYLFSSVMDDLVGAGFPFIGGAVLFIAGLISLSIRTKQLKPRVAH